jgi:CubicO group peptidase (beta-lactamase class C family)
MKKILLVALLFAAVSVHADPDFTGLWAAKLRFGPDVRGTLTITGDEAEIIGRRAAVKRDGKAISFALPNDEGRFRGWVKDERIEGHWIQSNGNTYGMMTTPVTLTRDSFGRWSGTVTPIDAGFTMFFPITRKPDGTLVTYLRNPDRNVGWFTKIDRLTVEGNHLKFWDGDKVTVEGTYDPENDVMSVPLRGGTYDFHRAKPAEEAQFYPRGKSPAPYVYRVPPRENDGWAVASAEDEQISREGMEKLVRTIIERPIVDVHSSDVHAVIVARHGKIVLEEYFHGFHRELTHDTRSAAKSLTSFLAAAANVDVTTPVYATMIGDAANIDPRKRAITLHHLLNMASGLDADDWAEPESPGNEDLMQQQDKQRDWYRFMLDLNMVRNPGELSLYSSGTANLAGGVIAKVTGTWLPDLLRDKVFTPLQFGQYGLWLQPTGEPYMGGGTRLRLRDFMKLAQVIIDGGTWHGKRIISAQWAKTLSSPETTIRDRKYGNLWWFEDYPYNDRKVRAFFAGGNGGQIVMGVPELDLVIGFNGGSYNDQSAFIPQREYVPQLILPAVR